MSPNELEEVISNKEFTAEERAAIRQMLSSMHFRVRFWRAVGNVSKWIFAVAAGLVAIKLLMADYLKGIVR